MITEHSLRWKDSLYSTLILLLLAIVLFLSVIKLQKISKKPRFIINLQQDVVNIAPQIIKIFSLGQQQSVASLLWVETMLRGDLEHYKENKLKSWMFLRFNTITELAPYFYEAYLYGGMYLSVVKDDDMGAKVIFDKGLKKFPDRYPLLFQAGFHYFSELNDHKKAIEIFELALYKKNMHPFLPSLLARLKSGQGNLQGAFLTLKQRLKSLPKDTSPHIVNRLKDHLYAVKAEIDLTCLNGAPTAKSCDVTDYLGKPYILSRGTYRAQKKWQPYRIFRSKPSSP